MASTPSTMSSQKHRPDDKRLLRSLLVLIVTLMIATGLGIIINDQLFVRANWLFVVLASLLCGPPAAISLVMVSYSLKQSREFATVAALASIGIRLVGVLGGVVAIVFAMQLKGIDYNRFINWVAAIYVLTLCIETKLLLDMVADKRPEQHDPEHKR
jgi:uncharacterized membrane protein SirB2